MKKSAIYLKTQSGHITTGDGWFYIHWFSKIPKHADIDYSKRIIYEVFDYFKLSDYIKSLCWFEGLDSDCIYKYFPFINWNYIQDDDLFEKKDTLTGELIHILCDKWNKNTTG